MLASEAMAERESDRNQHPGPQCLLHRSQSCGMFLQYEVVGESARPRQPSSSPAPSDTHAAAPSSFLSSSLLSTLSNAEPLPRSLSTASSKGPVSNVVRHSCGTFRVSRARFTGRVSTQALVEGFAAHNYGRTPLRSPAIANHRHHTHSGAQQLPTTDGGWWWWWLFPFRERANFPLPRWVQVAEPSVGGGGGLDPGIPLRSRPTCARGFLARSIIASSSSSKLCRGWSSSPRSDSHSASLLSARLEWNPAGDPKRSQCARLSERTGGAPKHVHSGETSIASRTKGGSC